MAYVVVEVDRAFTGDSVASYFVVDATPSNFPPRLAAIAKCRSLDEAQSIVNVLDGGA